MSEQKSRRGCLWPMWPHDSRPTHEYCGSKRHPESPYCEYHRRMAIRDFETEPRQTFIPRKNAA